MDTRILLRRNFAEHWRANLAVMLGVVVAAAALTGALLVGDSVRGSLRAAALGRLGRVDFAVRSPAFFRERLAADVSAPPKLDPRLDSVCPLIIERGTATHATGRATVHGVSVLGIDTRCEQLAAVGQPAPTPAAGHRVVLNRPLADELAAEPGDDVLLRIHRPAAISPETLLGRRDALALTLRLTVDRVVPATGLGTFTTSPRQTVPRNAYVPLATLQLALGQVDRVNTLLIATPADGDAAALNATEPLEALLGRCVTLADLGLGLRVSSARDHETETLTPLPRREGRTELAYVALESDALLIAPQVETAARAAAASIGCETVGVLTYLANEIGRAGSDATIPYSTVAAIEPKSPLLQDMILTDGSAGGALAPGEVLLNAWAAEDLRADRGEDITLSYYVTGPRGRLETRTARLRLRGVVRLERAAADAGFTPEYPGLTDTESIADWDPPFPIDMRAIRPRDEAYWEARRATPKAFVTLSDGQRLWADRHGRFGRLTSLRAYVPPGESPATIRAAFEARLLKQLDPTRLGIAVEAVRARAQAAARGTTDFAGLFIGFSFFLIVSAAMLVALLFRLGVERRAPEIGLLLATGFGPRRVARGLLIEGVLIAAIGAAVGLLVANGYAWLMLAGLRSWWSDAVNTPFLRLLATWESYASGYVLSVLIAAAAIAWSLRGITRMPPRALLAGVVQAAPATEGDSTKWSRKLSAARLTALAAASAAIVVIGLSLLTSAIPRTIAFFVGGAALLIAGLATLTQWLRSAPTTAPRFAGLGALPRLGLRNARRHVGRSLLTAALIASAAFVITALQAMRLTTAESHRRTGGTGGFALMAESDLPLLHDLNTPAGRASLGLSDDQMARLDDTHCYPFRLSDGDETSCLNLYQPTRPRIVGATDAIIARGGFGFSRTLAQSARERENPWTLLRGDLPDGVIPTIADEASALWQLHLQLGDELTIRDERGRDARLRLVALLKGSILQGELIVAESRFTRLFPSISGYAFHLIETPEDRAAQVEQTLERSLADYGFAVTPAAMRLTELHAVQNTYLSTFQTLGGLGLLLGTLGLAVVMLRNVWERRAELALLRTLGFSNRTLATIVLIENAFLVFIGLLVGLVSAGIVVAPHALDRATPIPWASLLLMFAVILAAGLLAGIVALVPTLRAPLLPALRSE